AIYWELVFQQHPELRCARIVTNFADTQAETKPPAAGVPHSSESAYWGSIAAATQLGSKPLIPRSVARIRDSDSRYYAIARILLDEEFQAAVALNPSTLVLLFEKMNEFSGSLLEDVASGGISSRFEVGEELRTYLRENHPGNQARARALRDAIARASGRLLASAAWPGLKLAVFWRSPMLQPYVRLLAPHLSSIAQRDYLSMASEGTMSIPVTDGASGGVVANGIHFYEFIPEEDAEKAAPEACLPQELEIGGRYLIVLSTSAGLYRYDIGDVFRVTGFVQRTPIIEFLHRAGNTCSVTGEKLTEDQVTEAMESVTLALGMAVESFTAAPADSGFPRYVFLVEFSSFPSELALRTFCAEIDRALKARNIEYRAKRESQRLGAPELWVVKRGGYEARRSRRLQQGASDLQLKPTHLTRDPAFHRQFDIVERIHAD
ncbi:MAG TPA: GH3 auxin-responsive promoter family protein, partial [Candidatus Eisenbacteria bacterium]|nr:GH3 auxin-responsive promoter family protein [Candidatus Eisenbacteria bacterium]